MPSSGASTTSGPPGPQADSEVRGRTVVSALPLWFRELSGLLVGWVLFSALQGRAGHDHALAFANARSIQRLEQSWHLALEGGINHLLVAHVVLSELAGYLYAGVLVAPILTLVWLFLRHRGQYVVARRVLVVMTAASLPFFWLFPVAPPRFAQPGVVDVLAVHDILGGAGAGARAGDSLVNLYAATPSLHVAWACWTAFAIHLALQADHPRSARWAWGYAVLASVDVVATGNHYLVDVLAGALLFAVVLFVVAVLPARRRRRGARVLLGQSSPTHLMDPP